MGTTCTSSAQERILICSEFAKRHPVGRWWPLAKWPFGQRTSAELPSSVGGRTAEEATLRNMADIKKQDLPKRSSILDEEDKPALEAIDRGIKAADEGRRYLSKRLAAACWNEWI